MNIALVVFAIFLLTLSFYIEWYRSRTIRKFYHVTGFSDGTEHIEFYKGVVTCVSDFGERRYLSEMSLNSLEYLVRIGYYREIP